MVWKSWVAVEMFQESIAKYNVRYKFYLGNGDSSSFPAVLSAQPYGPDFLVEKLECCGHVQKRMGSRLRKLKSKFGKKNSPMEKLLGVVVASLMQLSTPYNCIMALL